MYRIVFISYTIKTPRLTHEKVKLKQSIKNYNMVIFDLYEEVLYCLKCFKNTCFTKDEILR